MYCLISVTEPEPIRTDITDTLCPIALYLIPTNVTVAFHAFDAKNNEKRYMRKINNIYRRILYVWHDRDMYQRCHRAQKLFNRVYLGVVS